jgi:hypothetical protein
VTADEIIDAAREIVADERITVAAAAKRLGVDGEWLLQYVGSSCEPMSAAQVKAFHRNRPEDTRAPGAKILGDPPAWRSALAKKKGNSMAKLLTVLAMAALGVFASVFLVVLLL